MSDTGFNFSKVTVTYKVKSLADIVEHFEGKAAYWNEQAERPEETQKRAAALREGARVWEQAANFLRNTVIEKGEASE